MSDKRDLFDTPNKYGITKDAITDATMELYVPHPGIKTEELARGAFKRELDFALSDPNLHILVYAATLLEE